MHKLNNKTNQEEHAVKIKTRIQWFSVQLCILSIVLALTSLNALAEDNAFDAKYKVVIQVSTSDEHTRTIALNNAVNLQQLYGMDNVVVEVVAYGPGLGILTKNNKNAKRVKSLAQQNIIFSACNNTMSKIERKTGKRPVLVEGVQVVNAGVARIIELQMKGYSYIRP
jgi:intracellular sulfur oxidation DsrE/DsrF family protein